MPERSSARVRAFVSTLTAAPLAALLALAGAPAVAHAEQPSPPPITNLRIAQIPPTSTEGTPRACTRTDVRVPGGAYTYAQSWLDSVSHDVPRLQVPAGDYQLHDCLDSYDGVFLHSSWLDPAPDPADETSGVIVTVADPAGISHPTRWGSLLIPTTTP